MKQLGMLMLASAMVIGLSACGGDNKPTRTKPDNNNVGNVEELIDNKADQQHQMKAADQDMKVNHDNQQTHDNNQADVTQDDME